MTTVLVTRPKSQAQNLLEMITQINHQAILFPTLEINDCADKTAYINTLKKIEQFDFVIFTSANAVEHAISIWPQQLPPSLKITAIGPATQAALQKHNISVDYLPDSPFNSESLLNLPALQQINNKHILIIAGEGGRDLLENTLKSRGATITKVAVYQRKLPNYSNQQIIAIKQQSIDLIVTTSTVSLSHLYRLFEGINATAWLIQKPLLVISQRLAEHAAGLGFKEIIVAKNPTDKAILEALKAWYASHHS